MESVGKNKIPGKMDKSGSSLLKYILQCSHY